jgi:hypothetical protein
LPTVSSSSIFQVKNSSRRLIAFYWKPISTIKVDSVWDLVNAKQPYPAAVPILSTYRARARHHLQRIENVRRRIQKRLGDLDEDPLGLPESCPGDSEHPSLSRRGHRRLINQDKALLAALEAMYAVRCKDTPPSAPVPVPIPIPIPLPAPGSADTQTKVAATVSTGLVVNLLISEGSRLFLPRNLLPIP